MSESKSVMTTTGLTKIAEPVVPPATGVATTIGATVAAGRPTTVTMVDAGNALDVPVASTTAKLTDFTPAVSEESATDANSC